jgi:hypothetical protein
VISDEKVKKMMEHPPITCHQCRLTAILQKPTEVPEGWSTFDLVNPQGVHVKVAFCSQCTVPFLSEKIHEGNMLLVRDLQGIHAQKQGKMIELCKGCILCQKILPHLGQLQNFISALVMATHSKKAVIDTEKGDGDGISEAEN